MDLNYSQIVTELDKLLPNTTDFDYTTIDLKEYWNKIEDFFRKIGIYENIESNGLKALHEIYMEEMRNIPGRISNNSAKTITGEKTEDFDQNNYYIKDRVSTLKRSILDLVISKKYFDRFDEVYSLDSEKDFDEIDKSEYVFSREEIENYLRGLLYTTAEKNDYNNPEYGVLLDEITTRFFLSSNNENLSQSSEKNIIDNIRNELEKAYELAWSQASPTRISKDLYKYGTFNTDYSVYNSQIEENIKKIAAMIEKELRKKIDATKENEKKLFDQWADKFLTYVRTHGRLPREGEEEYRQLQSISKSVEKKTNGEPLTRKDRYFIEMYEQAEQILGKGSIKPVEKKPEDSKAEVIEETITTEEPLSEDFSELVSKYDEMTTIIEENKKIMEKISEIDRQLAVLSAERKKLNGELLENNKKMGI